MLSALEFVPYEHIDLSQGDGQSTYFFTCYEIFGLETDFSKPPYFVSIITRCLLVLIQRVNFCFVQFRYGVGGIRKLRCFAIVSKL